MRLLIGMPTVFASLLVGTMSIPAQARPVVVELFTSEGCSSCPPADAYLTSLARGRSDVLPLAFHVTYWNSLGWRDPYSFEGATARQNDYASRLGSGTVFTPQMVVDGRRSVVGSDRGEADALIGRARAGETSAPVSLRAQGNAVTIRVGPGQGVGRVLLVGFDHEHQTHIGRGGEQRPNADGIKYRSFLSICRKLERQCNPIG